MERIAYHQKLTNAHEFYCDKCNKLIGSTFEHENGYYEKLGAVNIQFELHMRYKFNKTLCEYCYKQLIWKLDDTFLNLGFIREV